MPRSLCLVVAAVILGSTPSGLVQARAAEAHASGKKKPVHAPKPQIGTFGISNSLNAPSTDFSHVTPATGEETETRGRGGPVLRPSVDSNGNPAMGLGF